MKEREIGPDLRVQARWEAVPVFTAAPLSCRGVCGRGELMEAKPTLRKF